MKYAIALIATCLLASCSNQTATTPDITDHQVMCVAGFVEDRPGYGTLDVYIDTTYMDKTQSITGVSVDVVDGITNVLGSC